MNEEPINLVVVYLPGVLDVEDYKRIAVRVREVAPNITVYIHVDRTPNPALIQRLPTTLDRGNVSIRPCRRPRSCRPAPTSTGRLRQPDSPRRPSLPAASRWPKTPIYLLTR